MKNNYEIKDDITEIYVKIKGEQRTCLIDTEDLEKVSTVKHTWMGFRVGYGIYVKALKEKGTHKHIMIHRLITDCPEGLVVDHISGNTLDNRKSNLRVCTHKENRKNINKFYNI